MNTQLPQLPDPMGGIIFHPPPGGTVVAVAAVGSRCPGWLRAVPPWILLVLANSPTLVWFIRRLDDGSGEPYGLIPLGDRAVCGDSVPDVDCRERWSGPAVAERGLGGHPRWGGHPDRRRGGIGGSGVHWRVLPRLPWCSLGGSPARRGRWSTFQVTRRGESFTIHERVVSQQDGTVWTDVQAWYWSALDHPLNGPWRAETVIGR